MITDEMIGKMITQHSGGYADIVKFLKDNGHESDLKKAKACNTTGEFAAYIQEILSRRHFPTVNHADWPKACAFWEVPNESNDKTAES